MLGATVMPHNLYLHSALVQTRQVARTVEGKRQANRYNFIDSAVALNCAFFVNAAILVLAASAFHKNGIVVTELGQAHKLLAPLLGTTIASTAFALALLVAGQSSTLTGTLAGQVVMEGFLNFRMRPWLRRLLTRGLALIPAVITIAVLGDHSDPVVQIPKAVEEESVDTGVGGAIGLRRGSLYSSISTSTYGGKGWTFDRSFSRTATSPRRSICLKPANL